MAFIFFYQIDHKIWTTQLFFKKKKFFKTLFHRSSWIQSPTPLKTIHKKTTKLGGGDNHPLTLQLKLAFCTVLQKVFLLKQKEGRDCYITKQRNEEVNKSHSLIMIFEKQNFSEIYTSCISLSLCQTNWREKKKNLIKYWRSRQTCLRSREC